MSNNYPVIIFTDGTRCYSGPGCKRHSGRTVSVSILADQFEAKMKQLDSQFPVDPIRHETPELIDTNLSEIYQRVYAVQDQIARQQLYIDSYNRQLDPTDRWYKNPDPKRIGEGILKVEKVIAELEITKQRIIDETTPGEEEYSRRGGWTRAFLVTTGTGHVHRNRSCSTCYSTTRFVWLPEYSGKAEATIVDDAGKQACTVCYPSAPVESLRRASKIEAPDRRAARLEREAAKAIRDKKNEEKSIFNPDGSGVKLTGRYGDRITSARGAQISAVDILVDFKVRDSGISEYYSNPSQEWIAEKQANYSILLKALAHKYGVTEAEQDKVLRAKAEVKFKKEWK